MCTGMPILVRFLLTCVGTGKCILVESSKYFLGVLKHPTPGGGDIKPI